jgi:hypothetical protein
MRPHSASCTAWRNPRLIDDRAVLSGDGPVFVLIAAHYSGLHFLQLQSRTLPPNLACEMPRRTLRQEARIIENSWEG